MIGDNVTKTPLTQNGDFASPECIDVLNECNIVVTNPPFSLFRKFIEVLNESCKHFLVIGNMNAITYKECFSLIKENKMWLGVTNFNKGIYFNVKENFIHSNSYKFEKTINDKKVSRVSGVCWFTNIDTNKRHEDMFLYKTYTNNEEMYPKYDNYDAINCDKVKDIPYDYSGVIGVPITFLDKYNHEQFEIIGCSDNGAIEELYKLYHFKKHNEPFIEGKKIFKRIFIKRYN